MIDTVNELVDSVNDGRGDALRVLRARRPAARARVRAHRHQASAGRALRGSPCEGKVDAGVVAADVARFHSLGVEHVALGDTIGAAAPNGVREMFGRLKGGTPIAHFHDTRGTGLVNYVAAYDAGVRHFDSS